MSGLAPLSFDGVPLVMVVVHVYGMSKNNNNKSWKCCVKCL